MLVFILFDIVVIFTVFIGSDLGAVHMEASFYLPFTWSFLSRLTGLQRSYEKISSRLTEIPVESTEISARRAGSLLTSI